MDSSRIDALQGSGRLDAVDAAKLKDLLAATPAPAASSRPAPERPDTGRDFPPGGRAFLSGLIEEDELRRRGRRSAIQMGVAFAILYCVLNLVIRGYDEPWLRRLTIQLTIAPFAGAAFGWLMHLALTRPAIARHVALREAAGPLQPIEAADAGQCPTCRAEEFEVWTWRKPAVLHWMVNPGLAVSELVLGQCLPAHMKTCKQCKAGAVDCPHCHRAIDVAHWGGRRAFGNWSGLRCPNCDGALPMLSNGLAWLIRAPFALVARLVSTARGRS